MGSSRLPGKVLKPFGSGSMLACLVERIGYARTIDSIVVATTTHERDDILVEESTRLGATTFRGSEFDVLDRYLRAARVSKAQIVVRVTADNPFTDPDSIDRVVNHIRLGYDYAIELNMPVGTTGEAVTMAGLEFMHRVARTPAFREHVTLFAKENPHLMRCGFLRAPRELARSDMSFTVDRQEDYDFAQTLFKKLSGVNFSLQELITLADTPIVQV